jgi:hypothetical protein
MCISEFSAPVKRFGNDVGCLTIDGKTCLFDYCSKPDSKFPANPQALICGNDHMSKLGVTGYESPDGWCSKVNKVLPGGLPTPLPVTPEPQAQTQTPRETPTPAPAPIPAPSVSFTDLGTGLCRTAGMEYPAYEQRQISEEECINACQQDPDCMGYAMSNDGYCQLYNVKSAKVPRTAKVGDMLEKVDGNPSWKCKVKIPKVAISGPAVDTLAGPPLAPTDANKQFDDVLLSQAKTAQTSMPATETQPPISTRLGEAQTAVRQQFPSLFQLPQALGSVSSPFPSAPVTQPPTPQPVQTQTPVRTATQMLGAVTSAIYAPQIQAYNACAAYFKRQDGGARARSRSKAQPKSKPSSALNNAVVDYHRNLLRTVLAKQR